uniref:Tc1-like transposase DDE domain-containing protein n=1 Tax=Oreochromis aureus TaxID=47969 RepID=A0AAZ1Y4I0_OREAU
PIINHGGEKLMTWPPCSPDLNPIENLWSIIKCEIYKEGKQYTSLNSVWEAVVAAARNVDGEQIKTLTGSMDGRLLSVLAKKGVVKLQNNRGNNKYSYTSNSDDNLLKNIELFDKLVLRFNGRVLFVKDVLGDEICCWSFYGEGRKIAEVCCTSIVYATEKKQTKVEFPEARIFKETLNILIYENNRGSGPGGLHLLDSREEEGAVGGDRRVRRIHVRRHIMHDERGHGQQTVYKD